MKNIFLFSLLLSFLSLASCLDDDSGDCIETLGSVTTESRDLDAFSSIFLNGIGNILLTQGTPQSVTIETHRNILPRIETTVAGGDLLIETDFCTDSDLDKLDIHITIPSIEELKVFGVGNITSVNNWELDKLAVDLNGVGNIKASGIVNTLNLKSAGVGNVEAFGLVASVCAISIEGTGNAEVTVNETLDITISGSGNVLYKGSPTVTSNISGTGTVIDAN